MFKKIMIWLNARSIRGVIVMVGGSGGGGGGVEQNNFNEIYVLYLHGLFVFGV